ncbi:SusC/RagA family TonB-linked outer membrane protein [Chitinophaga niabensis]|uniref:SusC/RagA family TonB-linked outer membrane protein n=1 Tax=Chitinophaga niabensis TaxID=536979 RepID=UPI0031BA487D
MKQALLLWLAIAISIPGVSQQYKGKTDTLKKILEEVVITGYNTATRKEYIGAVSTIQGGKLNKIPMASFDQMLQGRAPGLYVASGSGQPGAAAKVVIRGQATISGSVSPLYVVDGIAVESGVFMTMNPGDFESVSVLKDANATALYGSRGANGVILITTKRGKAGELTFTFNTQHGVSQPTRSRFNVMNTEERLQFEEEVGLETGKITGAGWIFSDKNPANAALPQAQKQRYARILDSLGSIHTNWRDVFLRNNAPFHEYELSASGGTEGIRFYSAANYYKQEGIALRSGIERYSFRTNLDVTSKRFTAAINTAVGYTNNKLIESEGSPGTTNTMAAVYYALPYEQPYVNGQLVHTGNKARFGGTYDTREGSDALERLQSSTYNVNQLKGTLTTALKYNFTDYLYASSNLGFDYRENVEVRTIKPGTYSGGQSSIPGRQGMHAEGMARYFQFTAVSGLTYSRTLKDIHQLTLAGFYEFNRMKYSSMQLTGYGITPGLAGTISGITPGSALNGFIPKAEGGRTGSALASWIALARYLYKDKYTLNVTFRRDGSSTVPESNRWHNFYAVGAGYDLKKEAFLAAAKWINTLRFRSSYGTSASPFSSNFAYAAGYGGSRYDGSPAIIPSAVGNDDYDWEYMKVFNVGVDLAILDNRLRLIADWYNKRTEGIFLDQQISQTSGFSSRKINAGAIRNRGIEIDLSGDIIRNANLTWSAGFNVAYNKNKVVSLGGVNEFTQGASIIRVGLPVNTHYIVKWGGVDPQTGKAQYYNRDGSLTTNYNVVSQSVATFGTIDPLYTGGITSRLNWKNFSAEVFFSFAQDLYRYNSEEYYLLNSNQFASSNQSRKWLDRWRKPGDITDQPSFAEPRNFTSRDIQDASYVRLRNAQLAYRIPAEIVKRTQLLRSAMIYVQGQNLLTFTSWTGFDPEDNNSTAFFEYPAARTITAGLSIQF